MNKKDREIFKHKVEQYPVIIDRKDDIDEKAQLLHFKDRLKDLNLNLAFGSELRTNKSMPIHKNALYVTGAQLQKPFYLGESLEEVKEEIMGDSEAEDFGPRYVQQYGYGVLTNSKIGRTTAIYANEEFDELPTEKDTISYAKNFYKMPDISRFSIDSKTDLPSLRVKQQKAAINDFYTNHKVPNGVKFINLEKLLNNDKFWKNPWVSSDKYDLTTHVYNGSRYGVMFIEDGEVAIHNISKKELETISNLEDYEFAPDYKKVAKDLAIVAPNVPSFSIDIGEVGNKTRRN